MIFVYIVLGIIQGFTEPIPISSSGHLILFKNILNAEVLNDLNFEIFSNFGSFIAIVILFRKDIVEIINNFLYYLKTKEAKYKDGYKYTLLIVIGTLPAAIVGFILKDTIEFYFSNVKFVGLALLITAVLLFIIRNFKGNKNDSEITYLDAFKVGIFQAFALFPGISRSGATIVGGMLTDLNRESAFKFSFMLYLPITLATMILGVKDVITSKTDIELLTYYIIGAIFAFILTLITTKWFKDIMINGKLIYFVYYCLVVGTLVIIFL